MGKGWLATASSLKHDKSWLNYLAEAYCQDAGALKGFIDQHADDPEVSIIRFERI